MAGEETVLCSLSSHDDLFSSFWPNIIYPETGSNELDMK